mmetsp:Transcript_35261/g.64492  ORF Transcript_35261/g.64492 Transcript_35261/m.64492 type:complete len:552 (+) Transcript_35261:119-1774(+)
MMRAETPQTPRRERLRASEAACEGDNKLTISPVPRQNSRMPVKISGADVCCSPTPCNKENMPPAWENCVMELNALSETTPCKADTSAGAEEDSDLAILWVGDSPHAQSPYQPAGEEDDLKDVEPDSLRRLLGPPKVRNTFLHYHSPLKTVKVMTPPNTVPPHFAPRTRLASPPARPRIFSPGPSPVPPNGVLRLFDFLPDLPPEGHCNVPPAPGQSSSVGNWCPSYQGSNADFSMPDFFGLPWDASMYGQDLPSASSVLPLPGMEGMQSQGGDMSGMTGTGSQSMMSWTGQSSMGQMSGSATYQQCQYTAQPTQTPLQSTTPSYQGMPQLPQQTSLPATQHGLPMTSTASPAAAVPQQLQQVQAQLQQLTLQLQQQAQMTQPSALQQMQQQIQQLQAQVQMCQDLGRTSAAPATSVDPSSFSTTGTTQVTPFSTPVPVEPPFHQWSSLSHSVVEPTPPASHADQTLPLQQQLEQVVAGRVNMSPAPGHFTEDSGSGSTSRPEGASLPAAGPARTSSSPSPSGSDARADPLARSEVTCDRTIRKMGRMGRRR